MVSLLFPLVVHDNERLVRWTCDDLEGPQLDVSLHNGVTELPADEPLGIEDCVLGIPGDLVLRCISDQALGGSECDVRGRGAISLVVRDDLDSVIPPNSNTRIGGPQVNADGRFSSSHACEIKRGWVRRAKVGASELSSEST
mmetsp:Transcript_96145/g.253980  ORF Transcript_96145/g.253980 Transcript_96145/m.253980 type:complete len:142 (+) Transcript_96145:1215-1640(+)